jgi:RND family efflux transporter MFP subunit
LRARVSGYLEKVNFKEGALVRKGAVLFKIDPRPYQAVYDSAVAQIKLNEAQMNQAIADNARARELAKTPGAISKQDLDKYAAIEATAAASVAAAKANAESARLNLEFTDVVSPIGGRASRYIVTVGNLVQAGDQGGGTLLTTIVSVDPMHANFDVDELTVQRARQFVRGGRLKSADESAIPVSLGLAAEEGFPHLGTINFVDNQVNPKTGTLRARGVFSNKDGALSPGYFARVRLPIGPAHRALLVNDRVVDNDQGQKVVYVVDKDHQVVSRPVRLGALHGGLREVRDGLMPGERVIVDGLQQVRPGTRVEAKLVPMPTPHVTHPNETTLTSGATP